MAYIPRDTIRNASVTKIIQIPFMLKCFGSLYLSRFISNDTPFGNFHVQTFFDRVYQKQIQRLFNIENSLVTASVDSRF